MCVWRRAYRTAGGALASLAALLGGGCDMRGLLYPVPPVAVPSPPPAPLEEVRLQVPGSGTVVAWSGAAPEARASGSAPLLLFFHGNGENLETMRRAGLFAEVLALGVAILAVDYPGYGRSEGEPSEEANRAAAEAAAAWARARHPTRPLVAFGWSLGAAVALDLAARHPQDVAGVVALSPWTSLQDVARLHFPGWLVGLALRERYDSRTAASTVRGPVLVMHGERDTIIPAAQGRELAQALGARARWVAVPGAGHNDLLAVPAVWREVRGFLDSLGRPGPARGAVEY